MLLLGLKHQQQKKSDCLPTCVAIVLDYLGISFKYHEIQKLLGTTDSGTSFPNILRLESALNLNIIHGSHRDTLSPIERAIGLGLPAIVALQTWPLPYWYPVETDHAAIVVGLDKEYVYLYDPFFEEAPQIVEREHFLTAWSERNFTYAIIGLAEWIDSTKQGEE